MSTGWRRTLVACSAVALALAAGCTSDDQSANDLSTTPSSVSASVVQPTSQAPKSTTAASVPSTSSAGSSSTSVTSASPSVADVSTPSSEVTSTSTSLSRELQEAADRAAVEAQWKEYWRLYLDIVDMPKEARPAAAAAVAVEPTYTNLLKYADYFNKNGRANYGSVTHRLSWLDPIAGGKQAVLADCQDQSQFGAKDAESGKKLTVGVERDNIKGRFVKGTDGIWRLSDVYYLLDIEC